MRCGDFNLAIVCKYRLCAVAYESEGEQRLVEYYSCEGFAHLRSEKTFAQMKSEYFMVLLMSV